MRINDAVSQTFSNILVIKTKYSTTLDSFSEVVDVANYTGM